MNLDAGTTLVACVLFDADFEAGISIIYVVGT
jgi:hypothetical protein